MKRLIAALLLMMIAVAALPAGNDAPLRFGVLAVRPKAQAMAQWQPLAAYLETKLGRHVDLTVYGFEELNGAVAHSAVDMVLTNPGHFILLQQREHLSAPLATLIVQEGEHELANFGGVIFTRADKSTINSLADLAGKYVAATNMESFGGYQMQAFELLEAGVAPPDKDKLLATGMPHDRAVDAVLDSRVDAGFVRSGVLEAMVREGKLQSGNIKLIHRLNLPSFPYATSTRLYPEWPVAVMPHVDQHLARSLAIALLSLPPDSAAAHAMGIRGFAIPADYSGVEEVLRQLRMPPFDIAPRFTLADLWQRYAGGISALLGVLVVVLAGMGAQLLVQNRRVLQGQKHFATLFEFSPEPTWIIAAGRFIDCNMTAVRQLGYTDKRLVLGHGPDDFSPPRQPDGENSQAKSQRVFCAAVGGQPQRFEWVYLKADGTEFTADVSLAPTKLNGRDVVLCVWRDITERKRDEIALRLSATVFAHSYDGITITDANTAIVDINPAFTRITGYSREEAIGRSPKILASGRHGQEFYAQMWQSLLEHDFWQGEIWNRRKSGEVYAEMLAISVVRDNTGQLQNYIGVFSDISRLKTHEAELHQIAHYDVLTGVPNRRLLADRLGQAIARALRSGKPLAVCYLDLDGFKPINDRYGHAAGDHLLVEIAERLKGVLRTDDTLARLGGDEFVMLLTDLAQTEEARHVLDRVLAAVSAPVLIEDTLVRISASIGVTIFPADEADADTLLRHADQAMYRAKEAGKNCYHFFDAAHDRQVKAHYDHLQRLRQALKNDEFVLHYQPKVDLVSGEVVGAEALIRWRHPERGLLAPGEFLHYLNGSDLEIAVGEWVIESVLKQIVAWNDVGLGFTVSANISADHLLQTDFPDRLRAALERHPDVVPGNLELEILETAALADMDQAVLVLTRCQQLGVHFALDDFGTGYSSLSYLRNLPVDILKIDQSFVRDMLDDPNDLGIVESVVQLASVVNRQVIAEGVETLELGTKLIQLGCRLAQGYGIARPMPAEQMSGWVGQWRSKAAWLAMEGSLTAGEDMTLLAAAQSHRNWIDKIVGHLQHPEEETTTTSLDTAHCRFGRWYQTSGAASYGALPEFQAIAPLHDRVHAQAAEIIAMARNGQREAAWNRLPELYETRDSLLTLIFALIEKSANSAK